MSENNDLMKEDMANISEPQTEKRNYDDEEYVKNNLGEYCQGILEILEEQKFGFLRSDNYLPGTSDVFVSNYQIRKYDLRTGDIVAGHKKIQKATEKFPALLTVDKINNLPADNSLKRRRFEKLTPIFTNEKIMLSLPNQNDEKALRVMDLLAPIGKGQRGLIVSPPKAGKTTLLKMIAKAIKKNCKDMHIIILLVDERPEEVTDMKDEVQGDNVDIIYSTFDEQPERHRRVSEMVIERAKRLVEQKEHVIILLDSITRLTRAYNMLTPTSGRTLSGGLDPNGLYMPKKFFGAARNMKEGGSLTILATALIDTGSKMDDVIYEEFKGTGNMELVLNRKLQERRVFPAIDIQKSGTRREDLLLNSQEMMAADMIHKLINDQNKEDKIETILNLFNDTKDNIEFMFQLEKKYGHM